MKTGDWEAHGHHRDAAYDGVVLHVVMWHDTSGPTRCFSGAEVPVLTLRDRLRAPASLWWSGGDGPGRSSAGQCPGAARGPGESQTLPIVESAGDARFMSKSGAFRRDMEREPPGEVLYRGIMTALGYSRNTLPFLELSRRLPLRVMAALADRTKGSPVQDCAARLGTVFLDAAGLGGAQPQSGSGTMSIRDWHLLRTRPSNSPAVRFAAMGHLLARYREHGLLSGMLGAVTGGPPCHENAWLDRALRVPGLGPGRAADIIVNVVLPFSHALGSALGQEPLCLRAITLYCMYHGTTPNSVTRHMADQLGLAPESVRSARRQQGLIHTYRTLCAAGKCGICPLAGRVARSPDPGAVGRPAPG